MNTVYIVSVRQQYMKGNFYNYITLNPNHTSINISNKAYHILCDKILK